MSIHSHHSIKRNITDWHTHWLSPNSLSFLQTRTETPRIQRNDQGNLEFQSSGLAGKRGLPIGPSFFDGATRIAHINEAGVSRQVISWPTTLGVDPALDATDARELFKTYNDDLAELVRQYPDRLVGLAALPTSDVLWAAAELDRGHRELDFIGAVLPAGAFISSSGARKLAPIFDVAQKHRSHIYLHTGLAHPSIPGQWAHQSEEGRESNQTAPARWLLEVSAQFSAAWITLALTDFLDAYPDVTVQIAMMGGVLTYLAGSVEVRSLRENLHDTTARLRRIYIDTGIIGSDPDALALAVKVFGAERILFGSDYPLLPSDEAIAAIERSSLSEAEKQTLFSNGKNILATHAAGQPPRALAA